MLCKKIVKIINIIMILDYLIISSKILMYNKPGSTEGYHIIRPRTSENTSWIIISIAVRSWTCLLKLLRIKRGIACRGIPIIPSAAILISVIHITSTTTPDGFAVNFNSKLVGASGSEVRVTPSSGAVSLSVNGLNEKGHIEAINEANVVVVNLC